MKKGSVGVLSLLAGAAVSAIGIGKIMKDKIDYKQNLADKHLALFLMMNQWVKVKQEGKNLADYLKAKGYNKVAIYGVSYAGKTLIDELDSTGIQVAYAIDKNAVSRYANIDIFSMENELAEADAIIVTAITFFDEIKEQLEQKVNCPIVSLEDILY